MTGLPSRLLPCRDIATGKGQEHGPSVRDAKHQRVSSRQRSYWHMFLLSSGFDAQAARYLSLVQLARLPSSIFFLSHQFFCCPVPSHLPFPLYLYCSVPPSLCCCARACRQPFPSTSSDALTSTDLLTSLPKCFHNSPPLSSIHVCTYWASLLSRAMPRPAMAKLKHRH